MELHSIVLPTGSLFSVQPTLSIITINRNNLSGLRRTLESVLAQTDREFEYIVIDGASSDGSRELLEATEGLDHWISEPDHGIFDAMNKGITAAHGEYLLFLNSGDCLFDTETLRDLKPYLGQADIVYGNVKFASPFGSRDGYMPDVIDLKQMMRDTLWHPASFIRRKLFDRYGQYDTTYQICGDYDFFFNVIVDKGVSSLHTHRFVAVFELGGISTRPDAIPKIAEEKRRSQRTWLSTRQLALLWAVRQARRAALRLPPPVRRLARAVAARSTSRLVT